MQTIEHKLSKKQKKQHKQNRKARIASRGKQWATRAVA
jgi:hypothetical protein